VSANGKWPPIRSVRRVSRSLFLYRAVAGLSTVFLMERIDLDEAAGATTMIAESACRIYGEGSAQCLYALNALEPGVGSTGGGVTRDHDGGGSRSSLGDVDRGSSGGNSGTGNGGVGGEGGEGGEGG
jgi:hypothetical protein